MSREEVGAWLDGELDAAEAAALEARLEADPELAAYAQALRALAALTREPDPELERVLGRMDRTVRGLRRRRRARWLVPLAAAALLLLALWPRGGPERLRGGEAGAQIALREGAELELGPGAEVELREVDGRLRLELREGRVRVVLRDPPPLAVDVGGGELELAPGGEVELERDAEGVRIELRRGRATWRPQGEAPRTLGPGDAERWPRAAEAPKPPAPPGEDQGARPESPTPEQQAAALEPARRLALLGAVRELGLELERSPELAAFVGLQLAGRDLPPWERAVPYLLALDPPGEADALGVRGVLVAAVGDADCPPEVRARALDALQADAAHADPRRRALALEGVGRALEHGDPTGALGDALLAAARADPEPDLRLRALGLLARSGSPRLGQALDAAEADPEPAVRARARALRER